MNEEEEIVNLRDIRRQMSSIITVLDDLDGYRAWSIVYAARKILISELIDDEPYPGVDPMDALYSL